MIIKELMKSILFSVVIFFILFLGFMIGFKQGEYQTRMEAIKEGHGVFLDVKQTLFVWRDTK
jgi:hypothetical protein